MKRFLTVLLLVSMVAHADSASEADLHYSLGVELYKQRRFEEALQHLLASNRLVPNANVAFNIALIYGRLERSTDAFNWYETYLHFEGLDSTRLQKGREAQDALKSKVAIINVTSSPPDVELFVDRTDLGSVGLAPRRLAVAPGTRKIIARTPGFRETTQTLEAKLGEVSELPLVMDPLRGSLAVLSTPAGAFVRREDTGEVLGVTPLTITLPVGSLGLRITIDGYVEQQRVVEIKDKTPTSLSVLLEQAASSVSVLSVTGTPEGARVKLGDRMLGKLPVTEQGLLPGTFLLVVETPTAEPFKKEVLLEAGAATRVEVHLVTEEDLKYRGLRWVGYGAGAAAVIVGAILGIVTLQQHNDFVGNPSRQLYDSVRTLNNSADGLLLGGVITLGLTALFDFVIFKAPQTRGTVNVVR
jgi:outer membrane receptor for ferrienterochelin and colicins